MWIIWVLMNFLLSEKKKKVLDWISNSIKETLCLQPAKTSFWHKVIRPAILALTCLVFVMEIQQKVIISAGLLSINKFSLVWTYLKQTIYYIYNILICEEINTQGTGCWISHYLEHKMSNVRLNHFFFFFIWTLNNGRLKLCFHTTHMDI